MSRLTWSWEMEIRLINLWSDNLITYLANKTEGHRQFLTKLQEEYPNVTALTQAKQVKSKIEGMTTHYKAAVKILNDSGNGDRGNITLMEAVKKECVWFDYLDPFLGPKEASAPEVLLQGGSGIAERPISDNDSDSDDNSSDNEAPPSTQPSGTTTPVRRSRDPSPLAPSSSGVKKASQQSRYAEMTALRSKYLDIKTEEQKIQLLRTEVKKQKAIDDAALQRQQAASDATLRLQESKQAHELKMEKIRLRRDIIRAKGRRQDNNNDDIFDEMDTDIMDI